jgi:hypothetical protein
MEDSSHFRDVVCSMCGRHNRDVHMVSSESGVIVCSVCVGKCAEVLDKDTGIESPVGGWATRWPLKR